MIAVWTGYVHGVLWTAVLLAVVVGLFAWGFHREAREASRQRERYGEQPK